MKVLKPTTVKIEGVTYTMRPGCEVPAPVYSHWRKTDQLPTLLESKTIDGYPGMPPRESRPVAQEEPEQEQPSTGGGARRGPGRPPNPPKDGDGKKEGDK